MSQRTATDLQIVFGERRDAVPVADILREVRGQRIDGSLYLGYPVLATTDDAVAIDCLLVSPSFGVWILDFPSPYATGDEVDSRQIRLLSALRGRLSEEPRLNRRSGLKVEVNVVSVFPSGATIPRLPDEDAAVTYTDALGKFFEEREEDEDAIRLVDACVQRVANLRPRRKRDTKKHGSRGSILKEIEAQIANLDWRQKQAAIEVPDSPQRIRGLAGSGKTIVLALKAAYLHTRSPDARIAVVFHTRSLYQQFREHITRFVYDHSRDEPNWERLQVLHSWGSYRSAGFYSTVAAAHGLDIRDLRSAEAAFGRGGNAFRGVCNELRDGLVASKEPKELFDTILIDEGQDLPQSLFEIAHLVAAEPKRVVYAYDELQNLGDEQMSPPSELFGKDRHGRPRVEELANEPDRPKKDILLSVCYRNTPWALTVAHALGLGIHREGGADLVQYVESDDIWEEIGYEKVSGKLQEGEEVSLRRRSEATPSFFRQLLKPEESVAVQRFKSEEAQAEWIAREIDRLLKTEELDLQDFLVVFPQAQTAPSESALVSDALQRLDIRSHLVGVGASRDEVFSPGSVAMSGIYRAKGNEAPVVFVANANHCTHGYELEKRRSALFTAMTRSRAWLYLCGVGDDMDDLAAEVTKVVEDGYKLSFKVPTQAERERIRRIHRDLTPAERKQAQKAQVGIQEAIRALKAGSLTREQLSPDVLRQLRALLGGEDEH